MASEGKGAIKNNSSMVAKNTDKQNKRSKTDKRKKERTGQGLLGSQQSFGPRQTQNGTKEKREPKGQCKGRRRKGRRSACGGGDLEAHETVDGAGRGGQHGALEAEHRRSAHVGRQRIDAVEHGDAQPLA